MKGMCPLPECQSPVHAGQGYCTRHLKDYHRNYRGRKRKMSRATPWNRTGPRQAPADWRDVLAHPERYK